MTAPKHEHEPRWEAMTDTERAEAYLHIYARLAAAEARLAQQPAPTTPPDAWSPAMWRRHAEALAQRAQVAELALAEAVTQLGQMQARMVGLRFDLHQQRAELAHLLDHPALSPASVPAPAEGAPDAGAFPSPTDAAVMYADERWPTSKE